MFQELFLFIVSYRLGALETLYFYFFKVIRKIKKLIEKGFLQRILQEIMKKKKYLEHQTLGRRVICPIDPAYYIED